MSITETSKNLLIDTTALLEQLESLQTAVSITDKRNIQLQIRKIGRTKNDQKTNKTQFLEQNRTNIINEKSCKNQRKHRKSEERRNK